MTARERVENALREAGSKPGSRGKWLCPAHADKTPSLSVREGGDGRALVNCFAGCSIDEVLRTIGLEKRDLFPDAERDLQPPDRRDSPVGRVLGDPTPVQVSALTRSRRLRDAATLSRLGAKRVSAWNEEWLAFPTLAAGWKLWAVDADGRARREDGKLKKRNDGSGSLIVAYELRAPKPERFVRLWDVEGESDLIAAVDSGLSHVITGTAGAASLVGHDRHERFLAGLGASEVIVIRDRDKAGREGAEKAAQWWHAHGVKCRIVVLPEALGENGDLRDYLNGRPALDGAVEMKPIGDADSLNVLADAAPLYKSDEGDAARSASASGLPLVSMGALLAEPEEEQRWLVDELLIQGGLSALVGKPKAGKSTLARALALSVAQGNSFLGRGVSQGAVIYLALEEIRGELRRYFEAMGARKDDPIEFLIGRAPDEIVSRVDALARERRPALIIVDTLQRFCRVRDLNDYAEVTRALEPILAIARETGAHVLLVHHGKKGSGADGDSILGSSAILGSVDCALMLRRSESVRFLSSIQRYGTDLPETVIDLDSDSHTPRIAGTREEYELGETEARVVACLRTLGSATESELDEGTEGRKSVKVRALRALVARGVVSRSGEGKKRSPFVYSVADSGSHVPGSGVGTRERETVTADTRSGFSGSQCLSAAAAFDLAGNESPERHGDAASSAAAPRKGAREEWDL